MTTPPSEDGAYRLIERYSRYLEPAPTGLVYYEQWLLGEEEVSPGMSALVRLVALRSLDSKALPFVRSAVQALACTGNVEDVELLQPLLTRGEPVLSSDARAAIAHIEHRAKSLETLLAEVNDRSSFVAFARELAKERESAAALEAQDPARYPVDGARGWKNADISSFIYAGLSAFEGMPESAQPTWAAVAEFLYRGKVLE